MPKTIKKQIRWFRYRSCIVKKRYSSFNDTFNAIIKKQKNGVRDIYAYKCLFGNHYHIGHFEARTRQRINKTIRLIGEVYGN